VPLNHRPTDNWTASPPAFQDTLWKTAWPQDLSLTEKVYGDLAALKKDSSICERSWCFHLTVVIKEENKNLL